MHEAALTPAARLLTLLRLLIVAGFVTSSGLLLGGGSITALNLFWCALSWALLVSLWVLLERYRQALEQADASACSGVQEGRFLTHMGHDLRQPAQAIALFAATLSAHPLPESSRKLVAGIESAVEQLSAQLEAVFSIAKLEAGEVECALKPVSLDGVFAQAANTHLDDAHERQLHLRHVSTGTRVLADEALLTRAVDCMVAHAVAITGEGGVVLGCRQRGSMVLLEVWDSSEGIAPEMLPQVFVPGSAYGQNLTDRGLGLVLARRMAELMGGVLTIASRPGRGCVLRLAIPRA
jgi:signal transduction histidine kinase